MPVAAINGRATASTSRSPTTRGSVSAYTTASAMPRADASQTAGRISRAWAPMTRMTCRHLSRRVGLTPARWSAGSGRTAGTASSGLAVTGAEAHSATGGGGARRVASSSQDASNESCGRVVRLASRTALASAFQAASSVAQAGQIARWLSTSPQSARECTPATYSGSKLRQRPQALASSTALLLGRSSRSYVVRAGKGVMACTCLRPQLRVQGAAGVAEATLDRTRRHTEDGANLICAEPLDKGEL